MRPNHIPEFECNATEFQCIDNNINHTIFFCDRAVYWPVSRRMADVQKCVNITIYGTKKTKKYTSIKADSSRLWKIIMQNDDSTKTKNQNMVPLHEFKQCFPKATPIMISDSEYDCLFIIASYN